MPPASIAPGKPGMWRSRSPRSGNQAGLSQKDLAKHLNVSQQQSSRLESPAYEGHSLGILRRVAKVLHARVRVTFEPEKTKAGMHVAETAAPYRAKRSVKRRAGTR